LKIDGIDIRGTSNSSIN